MPHTTPYKDPCPSVGFIIGLIRSVEKVTIYFKVVFVCKVCFRDKHYVDVFLVKELI